MCDVHRTRSKMAAANSANQKNASDAPLTETISTPLTKLFGIKHPIMLAGMNVAAGPELAAAVTNAGM